MSLSRSSSLALCWLLFLSQPCSALAQDSAPGDDDDSAEDEPYEPDEDIDASVVVTAKSAAQVDTKARTEISPEELTRSTGQDVAETISQVAGVTVARGTADSSKPVIRGQHERRLLVLFDGVRHESQKWGADHATEIDPYAAGSISVIKGASGVRYGPDAIGGVVLIQPPRLLSTPGIDGVIGLVGVTQGWRVAGSGRLDLAPAKLPGFVARIEGNYSRGTSLRTPDYVLGNTGSQVWNAGTTLHYHRPGVHLTVSYSHYDLRAGIFYGIASSTPAEFGAQLEAEAPVGSDAWTQGSAIDRPFQAVAHDRMMARAEFFVGRAGTLTATYAFQHNRRREFEQARASILGPQYEFVLRTHSLDVVFDHSSLFLGPASLRGGLGVSGSFQENVFRGVPLVPNHRAGNVGVFGHERLTAERFALEIGARYDHQSRTSFLSEAAHARHLARGTLSEGDCTQQESATRCGLSFDAGSLSTGLLVHVVPDVLDMKLDLSSATRFPNGDELYMNGSAPTFPVYALGDPALRPETTWNLSPTLGLRLPWFEGELSGFFSYIDDYIAFAPELGSDGSPAFDVTIRGAFPRFGYRAVDSLFYGIDGGFTVGPSWPVSLRASGSLVRGEELSTGTPLLFVPADRMRASLRVSPPHAGPVHSGYVELSGEFVFKQRHTDEARELAPSPDGYVRVGAGAGATLHLPSENELHVGLEANNLLNARYRDYTSLLRYYADEPGLEVRLRVRFEFHQHPRGRTLDDPAHLPDPDHHPDEPVPDRLRRHREPQRDQ